MLVIPILGARFVGYGSSRFVSGLAQPASVKSG